MKKYIVIVLTVLLIFVVGCAESEVTPEVTPEVAPTATPEATPEPTPAPEVRDDILPPDIITGTIEMEDGGIISFELYPDIAPQSVRNFVYLARQGFYDGLRFHRIVRQPNGLQVIQGGCPDGTGRGNPGYSIFGEFEQNGFENNLSHTRGVISMARAQEPNSAGSQFFIMSGDSLFLDGGYAAFGMVTNGLDVVDRLAATPLQADESVAPSDMPVIRSITIDGDFAFPEPDKLPR